MWCPGYQTAGCWQGYLHQSADSKAWIFPHWCSPQWPPPARNFSFSAPAEPSAPGAPDPAHAAAGQCVPAFVPVYHGESLVLRLLRSSDAPPNIEDLGFSKEQINVLKRQINRKSNLILICGATGAGKTTTLSALLNILRDKNQKVITIEDPVEYNIPGISQIQISKDLGLDFSKVLKSTFRHDPDVLMIGEIRDDETAKIAIRAALTGHLVLATLHTKDASSAISRLLDLGVKPYLLASVLGMILAQRLIPCEKGGRKAIAEILENSFEVKNLIMNKSSSQSFDEVLKKREIKRIWEGEYE